MKTTLDLTDVGYTISCVFRGLKFLNSDKAINVLVNNQPMVVTKEYIEFDGDKYTADEEVLVEILVLAADDLTSIELDIDESDTAFYNAILIANEKYCFLKAIEEREEVFNQKHIKELRSLIEQHLKFGLVTSYEVTDFVVKCECGNCNTEGRFDIKFSFVNGYGIVRLFDHEDGQYVIHTNAILSKDFLECLMFIR